VRHAGGALAFETQSTEVLSSRIADEWQSKAPPVF